MRSHPFSAKEVTHPKILTPSVGLVGVNLLSLWGGVCWSVCPEQYRLETSAGCTLGSCSAPLLCNHTLSCHRKSVPWCIPTPQRPGYWVGKCFYATLSYWGLTCVSGFPLSPENNVQTKSCHHGMFLSSPFQKSDFLSRLAPFWELTRCQIFLIDGILGHIETI